MAIHGSIEEAGLPNVLQVLALGGKTGRVAVERGIVHGAIYLDAGLVTWAEIVSDGDRLGDHLVRSGRITREQLRNAIDALTLNAAFTLAEVLVDAGSIARGELDRFVQHQVEEAVYLMCSWTKGQFSFTPKTKPPRHASCVSLHVERLLLEAGRRADDWTVIQITIPSFDRVYRRSAQRPGATTSGELSSEQHRILPLLDGTRDVNGLIELSGLSAFEVSKALLDLITAGLVQLQDRRSSARHFEEAELQAYALRAGEFADPERRKDAARHIADCAMCGGRLREVHVRRTQETPPQNPQELQERQEPQEPQDGYRVTEVRPQPPSPVAPPQSSRLSRDIVWLTSPQEADEIRRSHHRAVAPPPAAAAPTKPVAPAAAKPPVPPVPPAARPPAPPAPPATKLATPPPAPTKTPEPGPPAMKPRPEAQLAPEPVAPAVEQPPIRRRAPVRALAIAVAGAVVVTGAYVTLRSASGRSVRAVAANAPAPIAAPPVQSRPESITPPSPTAVPAASVVAAPASDTVRQRASTQPALDTGRTRTVAPTVAAPVAAPAPPPVPLAPDAELAMGGWRPIDRAEAINILGGRLGAIRGLGIESITTSEARGRTRVRVAQVTRSGQRIVLIETAGVDVPSSGAVRVTAVSVMPPLEASGESIGSASLGNLQITARSALAPDALRPLLGRLGVLSQP